MNKNTEQINIYKEDLLHWMIEVVHDQYGLQEPDYEKYLDNLDNPNTKFIDLLSEHTLQLLKDFVNILPNLQEIIYGINYNGTNPKITNMVMDGMVDSGNLDLEEICMYNSNLVISDLMLNGQIDSGNLDLEENKEN